MRFRPDLLRRARVLATRLKVREAPPSPSGDPPTAEPGKGSLAEPAPARPRGGRVREHGLPPSANGASSFHIWWDVPEVTLAQVSVILEVLTPPATASLAFFAIQASFWSSEHHEGGAHTGIQWNPRHPRNLAINWGGYGHAGEVLPGTVSPLASTPDDPNTRDFEWVTGARYRFTIGVPITSIGRPSGWPARVEGLDTGEDLVIRELLCGGHHLRAPVVWSELFGRCDDPSIEVRWSEPRAVSLDGSDVPVDRGRVTYQAYESGGCTNTTVVTDRIGLVQRSSSTRTISQDEVIAWRT